MSKLTREQVELMQKTVAMGYGLTLNCADAQQLLDELAALREMVRALENVETASDCAPGKDTSYTGQIASLKCERDTLAAKVQALEEERNKLLIALHSLTPGGSEYASDAEACVKVVREMRHQQHEVILSFKKQRDTIAATVEELKDLAEQLWIVLANVSNGDWTRQSEEWQDAVKRAREIYHQALGEEKG